MCQNGDPTVGGGVYIQQDFEMNDRGSYKTNKKLILRISFWPDLFPPVYTETNETIAWKFQNVSLFFTY